VVKSRLDLALRLFNVQQRLVNHMSEINTPALDRLRPFTIDFNVGVSCHGLPGILEVEPFPNVGSGNAAVIGNSQNNAASNAVLDKANGLFELLVCPVKRHKEVPAMDEQAIVSTSGLLRLRKKCVCILDWGNKKQVRHGARIVHDLHFPLQLAELAGARA